VNVPGETTIRAAGPPHAAARDEVAGLLRGLVRELRRQAAQLAAPSQGPGWPAHGSSLALLQEICGHPGVTVSELARLTGLPQSRESVLLTRLAVQRIVRKDDHEHDGRLVRLHMTPEGRRLAGEWQAASRQAIAAVLDPLSDAELDRIAAGLTTLHGAFGRAQRRGQREPGGGALPC
jgi:DNA-binding MarR family transcriptional regulator